MTVVAVDDEEISLMCLEGVLEQMEDVETITQRMLSPFSRKIVQTQPFLISSYIYQEEP